MVRAMKDVNGELYRRYLKRPLDLLLSIVAIIVFSPLFLIVAILVRTKLGSPIIFRQKRPGFNEVIFTMYKFRTMTEKKDKNGELLPDSVRLTGFGKFLRSTSLDELPELFNILKGDMAFVGPRPQLVKDLVFMTSKQKERHGILPGLTGWAQINGRNCVTWEEKLTFDLDYLDNITFTGDWQIIFRTAVKVFKRDGISTVGMDTSEDFGDFLLREKKINSEEYFSAIERSEELIGNR